MSDERCHITVCNSILDSGVDKVSEESDSPFEEARRNIGDAGNILEDCYLRRALQFAYCIKEAVTGNACVAVNCS